MNLLSERINNLSESQTIAMSQKSRTLKNQGVDVINLSLGEPDFNAPDFVKEAAKKAVDDDFSKYPPVAGYADLREAIARKFKRDNGLSYTAEHIVVSTGAKQSLANLFMCLLNKGDEVIVPAPFWVSYIEMIKLSEGNPVIIDSNVSSDFKITPEQLEKHITPKTKVFIYSSPCNPSGSAYTGDELEAFVKVLEKYPNIIIISDEIYEYILFSGKHVSIASFPSVFDRVAVVNGVSKGFALTGYRIGYLAAPIWLAKACDKMQGQITSAASSIAQRAALAAVEADASSIEYMRLAFEKRKDLMLRELSKIDGFKTNNPAGAFYVFPDISSFFGKNAGSELIKNCNDFSMYLLNEAHVSTVPGDAFGNPECVRISYAASEDDLMKACTRISEAVKKLK